MNPKPTVATLDVLRGVLPVWLPKRTQEARTWSTSTTMPSGLKAFASSPHLPRAAELLATTARPFSIADESDDPLREVACHDADRPRAVDMLWELQHICLYLAQHCQIITRHHDDRITVRVADFVRQEPHIDPYLVMAVQDLGQREKSLTHGTFRLVDDVSRDGPDLILSLASTRRLHRFDGGHLRSQVLSVMHWLSQLDTNRLETDTEGTR